MLDKNRNIKLAGILHPILPIVREILYYIIKKNCIAGKLNFSKKKYFRRRYYPVFQFQFERMEENGGTPAVCYHRFEFQSSNYINFNPNENSSPYNILISLNFHLDA